MEAVLIYFLKASGVLGIFYLIYQVFLKKETFFSVNRHFLIAGLLTAITMPFIDIITYVEVAPVAISGLEAVTGTVAQKNQTIGWVDIFFTLYIIGVIIFMLRFLLQLVSLNGLIKGNTVKKYDGFRHVETNRNIAPFSFFNHIFYNPSLYNHEELKAIIKHEKAHSSQWHSVDVLITHIIAIIMWANPFSWLYLKNVKQNLEFLADATAIEKVTSKKTYQYTLLKVSGNQFCTPITNNFYNSLIKKRIVMLNKSRSNKKNVLKTTLILPALAIFLLGFNTREVHIPIDNSINNGPVLKNNGEMIVISIDKNTTDKELKEIKKDLSKKGIDFSYTTVHNKKREIIDLSVQVRSNDKSEGKFNGSANFNNDNEPIEPITITFDVKSGLSFMKTTKGGKIASSESESTIWVHSDDKAHKTIEIESKNGKEIIKVNGKEISRYELEKMKEKDVMHGKHIKIIKTTEDEHGVIILKDSDVEEIKIVKKKGKSPLFIDDEGKEPIYFIDDVEATRKEVSELSHDKIESMNVLKGKKAIEKYGAKGENGIVKIITKKKD